MTKAAPGVVGRCKHETLSRIVTKYGNYVEVRWRCWECMREFKVGGGDE